MSDILNIRNFKCFRRQQFELKALTVLVGANGMGKSTVLQSLLLLRHYVESKVLNDGRILLNGPMGLSLGDADSIQCSHGDGNIAFSLTSNRRMLCGMTLEALRDDDGLTMLVSQGRIRKIRDGLTQRTFYYLSAERNGPRVSQTVTSLPYSQTGFYGEHTAQILADKYKKVPQDRCNFNKTESVFLHQQVNAWLSEVFPGVEVRAEANYQLQCAQIQIRNSINQEFMSPTNIGFGISYVLPILVTGLVAEKGSYVIVENPESHLHPSAQTALGKFLGMLASSGMHVVIETHSDHVLNGIQIYVASHPVLKDDVVIYNFSFNNGEPKVDKIFYDNFLGYNKWPDGFMNQSSKDYLEFYSVLKR